MTTFLFFLGAGLTIGGVAMLSVPAALIVAGVLSAAFAAGLEVNG